MKIIDTKYILTTYNQIDIFTTFLSYFTNIEGKCITRDIILECINQRTAISSPFRIDEHPSVGFYYDRLIPRLNCSTDYCMYGKLKMRDFTSHRYSISNRFYGDCFDLVRYILLMSDKTTNNLTLIAKIIDDEMKDKSNSTITLDIIAKPKERKSIAIQIRQWNLYDQKYWSQYGFTSNELKRGYVYPVEMAWINYHLDNRAFYKYHPHNPCYAYYYGIGEDGVDNITLYFPYANSIKGESKFITNNRCFQGINTLTSCENLIITKSYKDVLLIRRLILLHLVGDTNRFNSIAVPSENYNITQTIIDNLKQKYNIERIFTLFDNDVVGKRYTYNISKQTNIIPLLIPSYYKSKDITDLYSNKGQLVVDDIITNFINNYI